MKKKNVFTNEEKSFEEDIVQEIIEDFKKRQEERRNFEAQWELNMNFLMGNQYCDIGLTGEIEEYDKQFYWQEREVYNHIAPIMDSRLAKLLTLKPTMAVVPASSDERDIKTAKLSKKIVNAIYNKLSVSGIISEANNWSEVCGTSFYKITWNASRGTILCEKDGEKAIASGDIEVTICPPFEIFPESSSCADISDCKSLIHAKAFHVDDIKKIWGVEVKGEDINVFSLDNLHAINRNGYLGNVGKIINGVRNNYAIVIERYESPSIDFPNGRLIIIAGDKLVYVSELPYINGNDGERGFPFIRQTSIEHPGCFWGSSLIERLIPLQRSYNTIKNRKHEFMNRLSMGVLTVEDGSVDTDNLEGEGLSPGKILVYRQGSTPPTFMSFGKVPVDFSSEEATLLNEFTYVSGVSDMMTTSSSNYANMSGEALQILVNQDDSRIAITADKIREAIKNMAKHILRLYKQFASIPRLSKIVGDNGEIEVFYFNSSDISSDDIILETTNEIGETVQQKRNMVFQLLNAGLLHDESGKLSNRMRIKILDLLGFGIWENSQDINELHIKKATTENL
ncbi:MAG: hypothetical protein PHS54_05075, partial [Clostridia bacterium]|nr:hypothetical protein [Clostridia bacterium]